MNYKQIIQATAAATAISGGAQAAPWFEFGDAGQSLGTANITSGIGSLTTITGALEANGADIFKIKIVDVANFSATQINVANGALYLFDSNGNGVTFNDNISSSNTRAKITGINVPAVGYYYLAFTSTAYRPTGATSQQIWLNSPATTERAPDGPDASSVLTSWSGGALSMPSYQIDLTGAEFAVPAPGTAALALAGLGAIVAGYGRQRNR